MYYLNGVMYEKDPYTSMEFYGKSLFETIAIIDNKPLFLKEHLERLNNSAKKIKLKINDDIEEILYNLLNKTKNLKEGFLKIQVSENKLYIKIEEMRLREFPEGIRARFIDDYYQNELGMYKSANYLINILAREELVENGFFEGVFTNRLGEITEGTISNLFFIKNNILYTPELSLNILPGITRKKIIDIAKELELEVQEGLYTKKDLNSADSIFFTNSLMKTGIIWVRNFQGLMLKKDEIIHKLENNYLKMQGSML